MNSIIRKLRYRYVKKLRYHADIQQKKKQQKYGGYGIKPVSCKIQKFENQGNAVFPQKISIANEVRNVGVAISRR